MRERCLNVIWITGALCSLAAGGVKINLEKQTFLSWVCTITVESKTKHNVVFEQLGPSVLTTLHDLWVCIPPPPCLSAVPVHSERPGSFSLPCARLGMPLSSSLFMYPICRMQSSVIDLKLSFLGTHRAFRICFSNSLEMRRLPPYGEHLLRRCWLCTLLFRRHAALCTQNCFGFEPLPWCRVFDDTGNITIPNKRDINMKYAFSLNCNSMSKEETNSFP